MGWLESPTHAENVLFAHACYSQLQPSHPHVLTAGLWCEYKTGLQRKEAEEQIGIRRKRLEYVEFLAKACQEGLRDIEHFDSATSGVCWVGGREWSEEEGFARGIDRKLDGGKTRLRKGESRNGEREYLRRAFEECHARFGVEVWIEWGVDGVPSVKLKTPRLEGTKFTGDFIDIDIDPSMADPVPGL
ncbi:hypothetical protein B0J14DRAFT_245808 [Halenospora varia]|nr:hypothetical protein B0J14DRAFT_245808 [Halenospora varia]